MRGVAAAIIVDATGVSGDESVARAGVASVVATAWPFVGVVLGRPDDPHSGSAIAVTARALADLGRASTRALALETPDGDRRSHDWDALSEGDDPTGDPR